MAGRDATDLQTVYTELSAGHFRLIELCGFDPDGCLKCKLRVETLLFGPEYDAISYAWNRETPSVSVECNNQRLLVTPSLHSALCTLVGKGQRRTVWADAICIDQSNNEEKAQQVPLMDQIYSRAQCVILWLGTSGPYTDLALDSVHWLNTLLDSVPDSIVITDTVLSRHGLPLRENPVWEGIKDLFSRPWFRRLWVVQEVALAREIVVTCGSRSTSWERLTLLADHIGRVGLVSLARGSVAVDPGKSDGFDAMMVPNFVRSYRMQGKDYPLTQLCHYARSRDTSEPIDKVYAMLSLTDEAIRAKITVDYSLESRKNYWKAYVDLVATLLPTDPTLFLLQICQSQERPPELPSWCPNLNSTSPCIMLSRGFYKAGGRPVDAASEEVSPFIGVTYPDKRRVSLRGIRVDFLEHVLPSRWNWDQEYEKQCGSEGCAALGFKWMNECRALASKALRTGDKVPVDLVRTLIADILHNPPAYAPDTAELQQSVSDATVYLQILRDDENAGVYLKETELFRAQRYLRAMDLACRGRCFFTTMEGRIGIGPLETWPGDTIVVLKGAQVPFIFTLKPRAQHPSLVGEAYIHGIMQGEVVCQDSTVPGTEVAFEVV